jgi:hypothetical protein
LPGPAVVQGLTGDHVIGGVGGLPVAAARSQRHRGPWGVRSGQLSFASDEACREALWETELAVEPAEVASALLRRLARVPDCHARRGLRHPPVVVLVLTARRGHGRQGPARRPHPDRAGLPDRRGRHAGGAVRGQVHPTSAAKALRPARRCPD